MNCDQAFDCLTDRARRYSAELDRHLAACPRCRHMCETLEPALDLFDDVVAEPDVSRSARGAPPVLSTESVRLAEQTAAQLSAARERPRRSAEPWSFVWRYAAVFLIGGAVVLGVGAVQGRLSPDTAPQGASCTWRNPSAVAQRDAGNPQAVTLSCITCHMPRTGP